MSVYTTRHSTQTAFENAFASIMTSTGLSHTQIEATTIGDDAGKFIIKALDSDPKTLEVIGKINEALQAAGIENTNKVDPTIINVHLGLINGQTHTNGTKLADAMTALAQELAPQSRGEGFTGKFVPGNPGVRSGSLRDF